MGDSYSIVRMKLGKGASPDEDTSIMKFKLNKGQPMISAKVFLKDYNFPLVLEKGGLNKFVPLGEGVRDMIKTLKGLTLSEYFKENVDLKQNTITDLVARGHPANTLEIAICVAVLKGELSMEEAKKLLSD